MTSLPRSHCLRATMMSSSLAKQRKHVKMSETTLVRLLLRLRTLANQGAVPMATHRRDHVTPHRVPQSLCRTFQHELQDSFVFLKEHLVFFFHRFSSHSQVCVPPATCHMLCSSACNFSLYLLSVTHQSILFKLATHTYAFGIIGRQWQEKHNGVPGSKPQSAFLDIVII